MWGNNSHRLTKIGEWKIWKWKHESILAQEFTLSTISVPGWPVDHLLLLPPVGCCTMSQSWIINWFVDPDNQLTAAQRTLPSPDLSPTEQLWVRVQQELQKCSQELCSSSMVMPPSAHMSQQRAAATLRGLQMEAVSSWGTTVEWEKVV